MLKSLLISFLILLLVYFLKLYVDGFKSSQSGGQTVSQLEGITIRAYGKGGIEWTIKGEALRVVGRYVHLHHAELLSQEARIKAGNAYIDRLTGEGKLSEGVEFFSQDVVAHTQSAFVNLREGRIWSEDYVSLAEGKNLIEGKGFEINLKPLRIIINRAKVRME